MGNCFIFRCWRGSHKSTQPLLFDHERKAIAKLIFFLDNLTTNLFAPEPMGCLDILSQSQNPELLRSTALAFAEITENYAEGCGEETIVPILRLLHSVDTDVQRSAASALGNLSCNVENKLRIVQLNALPPLASLLKSQNQTVLLNVVGCITNLASVEENRVKLVVPEFVFPLLDLSRSHDTRIVKNATGAILNITHSPIGRRKLVDFEVIPVLNTLLTYPEPEIQYYATTALTNIAVDPSSRTILATHSKSLLKNLISLCDCQSNINSTPSKLSMQAVLCMRNLASDDIFQHQIVRAGALDVLRSLLGVGEMVLATVAAIRNLSINTGNELLISRAGYIPILISLLHNTSPEIVYHSICTLRNLAAADENKVLICKGLPAIFSTLEKSVGIQCEGMALCAVLALSDSCKSGIVGFLDFVLKLVFSEDCEVAGNSAAVIANISGNLNQDGLDFFITRWVDTSKAICLLLSSKDPSLLHIGVFTLLQFCRHDVIKGLICDDEVIPELVWTRSKSGSDAIEVILLSIRKIIPRPNVFQDATDQVEERPSQQAEF